MKYIFFVLIAFLFVACKGEIKNEATKIEEEQGTQITELSEGESLKPENLCLGYWVGDFEPNFTEEDNVPDEDQYDQDYGTRTNKINLSLDSILGKKVFGHSVVAGNDRPFKGELTDKLEMNGEIVSFTFKAKEPGDHKNDGEFQFTVLVLENKLMGTWEAFKKDKIYKRKYELTKKEFKYDPSVMLEEGSRFVNWRKSIEEKYSEGVDGETYEWMEEKYAMTTDNIFKINASKKILKKSDVENMKKADLEIIRNTIYARHGYSFKNKVFRNFFDSQDWYIPVHADITKELTEMEKVNIKLLMRFEKNAAEYYDSFGR